MLFVADIRAFLEHMDGCSGKRAINGLVVSRKGSGLVLRDNDRDRDAQFCNRIGCSAKLNTMKGTQIGSSGKAKPAKPSFRASSSGKEIIGSSSRNCTAVTSGRKTSTNTKKKLSTLLETDSSETSSVQDELEVSETNPPGKIQRGFQRDSEYSDPKEITVSEAGSSSLKSSARSRRNFHQRSGLSNQDSFVGSSISSSSASINQGARDGSRYGLRNLKCNSVADVVSSGSSSSDSNPSRRKDSLKKRNFDAESSSSSRGRKITGPSFEVRTYNPSHGVSISDTRQTRNWPSNRDTCVSSVRTQRSMNSYNRTRLSNDGNGNILSLNESPVIDSQAIQPEISIDLNDPISTEPSPRPPSSYSRSGSASEHLRNLVPGSAEAGVTHSLANRDSFRRYNMDGIAEVLSFFIFYREGQKCTCAFVFDYIVFC